MSKETGAFRQAMAGFATGVTVVTTIAGDGEPQGVTVDSFNSVSLTPPLILFSLDLEARSLSHFLAADKFVVNVLADDQEHLSNRFAVVNGDKWAGVDVDDGGDCGPVLAGALAVFECQLETTYEGGDHIIFIGRVRKSSSREDAKPLLYYGGAYRRLG